MTDSWPTVAAARNYTQKNRPALT